MSSHNLEDLNLPQLKKLCRQNNISGFSTLKKSEIIELLLQRDIEDLPDDVELDEDQLELLGLPLEHDLTLVSAGPGAGKTTSLTHSIKYAIENCGIDLKKIRIIVISYNTAVEKHLNATLKNLDVKISSKKTDYNSPGVRVLTFHKLACAILKSMPHFKFNENNYRTCIRNAMIYLNKTPVNDFLFIDEAHDVKDELISFAESLYLHSNHTLLAGDPRQEINEGASWFTSLWNDPHSNAYKHRLKYNHRSCQRIVRLLNNYSEKAFKGSHFTQIATSEKKGRVKFICTEDVAEALYEQVVKYPDCLIVSPVSSKKYGLENIFAEVNQKIYYSDFTKRIRAIGADDKYLAHDDSQIFAASSLKIKGLEKRTVIILKPELDYISFGNIEDRISKRRLYVALSRARRNLIIIHGSKIENPYFSYLPLKNENVTYITTKTEQNIERFYSIKDCTSILNNLLNIPKNKFPSERVIKLAIQEPNEYKNILLKILVAQTLNLIPEVYHQFKENPQYKTDPNPGFHNGFLHLKNKEEYNQPKGYGNELTQIYLFMRALETGRWQYTEAEEFESILLKYSSDIKIYSKYLPFKLSRYQIPNTTTGVCLRSMPLLSTHVGLLCLYDFYDATEEHIVEIIYAVHSQEHFYRALVYASQAHKPVILYNAYEGKKYTILPGDILVPHFWNLQVPEQILRASHYIRFAKTVNKFQRVKIPSLQGKILVTYDVETYNCFPKRGCTLLEVGGIAIYPSGNIISLHYDKGDAEIYHGLEQYIGGVGITYPDEETAKESSEGLYQSSLKWAEQFKNQEISLKWAAQESDYLIIGAEPSSEIDVMKIYTEWRQLNNIQRARNDGYRSLSDCTFDIFNGIIPFRAHNAYEDAFMTLICFMAMIEDESLD